MTKDLKTTIESAWKNRINLTALSSSAEIQAAISEVIHRLDQGWLRVAEKINGTWVIHHWIKQAVLLSFHMERNAAVFSHPQNASFNLFSNKFASYTQDDFVREGFRMMPPATARYGSFIGKNVVIMPSFIDIGAHIGEGAMIDTWVSVGACAQIGKNVHLSHGVGIGGIQELTPSHPTIIEDNCFIGEKSEIGEGMMIKENSVISMGVHLRQSTPIYDQENDRLLYGSIPAGSIVVSGYLPAKNGKYNLYCAIIIKRIDAKTRAKTSITDLLREI